MSLILDALRKSEAERRRGNLPALALELPPPPPPPLRTRAWWLVFPVALALGALAFWLVRPDAMPTPAVQPAASVPEPPVQPLEVPAVDVPADEVPAVEARTVDDRPAETVTRAPPDPSPTLATSPPEPQAAPSAPSAPLLDVADLSPDERRALPPLKLSMHMWSEDPASRFVILDGHRLGEGDRAGNAVVERIDPGGVILAADGRRIRLPLP